MTEFSSNHFKNIHYHWYFKN